MIFFPRCTPSFPVKIPSRDRLDRFADMVASARQAGTELDIVINPVHAAQLEAIQAAGLWSTFEQWFKDIAQIVEAQRALPGGERVRLISFISYEPYAVEPIPPAGDTETTMQWWWECSHFKGDLGNLVLDRLYDPDSSVDPGFGITLTPSNVSGYIESLRQGRLAWEAKWPEDARFVQSVAQEVGLTSPASP